MILPEAVFAHRVEALLGLITAGASIPPEAPIPVWVVLQVALSATASWVLWRQYREVRGG